MKAAIYLGQENVEVRELPNPVCGDHDVVIKNDSAGHRPSDADGSGRRQNCGVV